MGQDGMAEITDSGGVRPTMDKHVSACFNIDHIDGRASTNADDNSKETAHDAVIGRRLAAT
jgi:hypothetical protein